MTTPGSGLATDIRGCLSPLPCQRKGTLPTIESLTDTLRQTRESIDSVVHQMRLYRGLSTLGISASVFGHETQTSISTCIGNLRESVDELEEASPDLELLRDVVPTAYRYAQRVGAWGAFAVARVRHEKRKLKTFRADELVKRLLADLESAYTAARTRVHFEPERVSVHAYEMDLEAIVLNLLTNAYSFAQQSDGERVVRVEVKAQENNGTQGVEIVVADSGPGVPQGARETIWQPLYTTKRDAKGNEIGTGLGLAIIDSILRETGGRRNVDADPHLQGARFTIWIPLKWV